MLYYLTFYATAAMLGLLWRYAFRQGDARPTLRFVVGAGIGALALWMWRSSEPTVPFSDFTVAYYPAGRLVLEDLPRLFQRCWDTPVCGFVNIPIVAFLFTPFSILTLRHAQWLFLGFSLTCLVLSLGLLWSIAERTRARRWAILSLFALNGPLIYSLKEGNLTHCALLLLVAGVVCLDRGWERSAGLWFALAAVIKLPLLLFGVYFFGTRRWQVVWGYGATVAALSCASLGYAGWASHADWYREVIQPFSKQGLTAFNVQSVEGLLLRLQDGAALYDWKVVPVSSDIKTIGRAATLLLLAVSAVLFLRHPGVRPRETMYVDLSMVLCLALIISPISWTHYYLLLLLPLSLYMGNRLPMPQAGPWPILVGLAILLASPPVIFPWAEGASVGVWQKLLLSHYLAGALLLWALLAAARWLVADVRRLHLVPSMGEESARRDNRRMHLAEPDDSYDQRAAG
ncbi:MAG: DUF2029 domain-containing protein [Nitrospira sp.]|nr:DUF2029 domain-containing protein [Nitrospira sp.]